jgi:hypothetical protein
MKVRDAVRVDGVFQDHDVAAGLSTGVCLRRERQAAAERSDNRE